MREDKDRSIEYKKNNRSRRHQDQIMAFEVFKLSSMSFYIHMQKFLKQKRVSYISYV